MFIFCIYTSYVRQMNALLPCSPSNAVVERVMDYEVVSF